MELKGKLVFEDESGLDNEVVAALKSLGYTKSEYEDMMKLIPNDLEKSEEKIGWILKRLGR
jgi:Holliday junction resolvasome RuvABC DNA-binding subunit